MMNNFLLCEIKHCKNMVTAGDQAFMTKKNWLFCKAHCQKLTKYRIKWWINIYLCLIAKPKLYENK